MNVLGHGIDTVDAARFRKLFLDGREEYLGKYFTNNELGQISTGSILDEPEWHIRLAGRFAAKEAVMKAIRHGFGEGLGFTSIEILTEENGAPTVALSGKAKKEALARGISQWWLSISHTGDVAFASAIACG